jgi:hypothetical protein
VAASEGATLLIVNRVASFTVATSAGIVAGAAPLARTTTLPQSLTVGQT